MNYKTKTLLAGALLASSTVITIGAQAATVGNIGATNNYIWRGMTQSNDIAAVSGGVDWDHSSGAYVGGWTSSLSGGQYELDIYGGYKFDTGDFSHDVGAIFYLYPVGSVKSDFTEIYYNFGWSWISAGVAFTVSKEDDAANTNDIYAYFGGDWVMDDLGVGFVLGRYVKDGVSADDYNHLKLHMSKDDFTVAIEKNDADSTSSYGADIDDVRFTVSWSKEFSLLN